MLRLSVVIGFLLTALGSSQAEIVEKTIEYKDGDKVFIYYLAYDDGNKQARRRLSDYHL